MNKADNQLKAYRQIQKNIDKDYRYIDYSIEYSKIYNPDFKFIRVWHISRKNINVKFELLNVNSDEALLYADKEDFEDTICLLNFASYKHPGGGFLKGNMTAQEESLCHNSTLYNVISEFEDFYEYNIHHTNYDLYLNRAIYSPVIHFNNGKFADVITCAAPNNNGHNNKNNLNVLKSRIKFILDIAEDNNADILILGAYGCGFFKQNPNIVAKLFIDECKKRPFKKVIFAVPGNDANYDAFEKALKENGYE